MKFLRPHLYEAIALARKTSAKQTQTESKRMGSTSPSMKRSSPKTRSAHGSRSAWCSMAV
jgi:hypothetical protein